LCDRNNILLPTAFQHPAAANWSSEELEMIIRLNGAHYIAKVVEILQIQTTASAKYIGL